MCMEAAPRRISTASRGDTPRIVGILAGGSRRGGRGGGRYEVKKRGDTRGNGVVL